MTAIAAGGRHSLGLKSDGTVWAWGFNLEGQLGNGTTTTTGCDCIPTPGQVAGLSGVTAIAAGAYHSLALRSDGTVWAWGYNSYGSLGNGTSGTQSSNPVQVSGLTGVIAIAGGAYHSLALKSDGTVWAWGYNLDGELGNGTATSTGCDCIPTAAQVPGLTNVTAVAGGSYHSLALKADGTVSAWGSNGNGSLGNGTTSSGGCYCIPTPGQVAGMTTVTAVAGGGYHSLALKSDGTVWAWGFNRDGELGNGTTTGPPGCNCIPTPGQVSGLTGVAQPPIYLGAPTSTGPSGTELLGAANPGETGGPFDLVADVVNAVTGNLTTAVTDLAIPGRGPGLNFTRTYNSLNLGLGPVGYGWVDTYDAHLLRDPATGNITVTNPNGSTVPFTFPQSGQTYGAPPWVTATLTGTSTAGWTYTLRDQTAYVFDVNGHLTSITDRNGNQVTLTHDPTSGLLTTVTEVGTGRALTLSYDNSTSGPRLIQSADSAGRTVAYYYDDAHSLPLNLDHVVDADGNTTHYAYNAKHQLLTATDQDGNTTTFAYTTDGSNRIGGQTDQMGRQYQLGWLGNGVTITDPRNIQTTITTDANEVTTVVRAGATLWQYGYDQYDNRQQIVDPDGNVWQTFYDAQGNIVRTIDPLGDSASATYNTFDEPLTAIDPNQVQTTYTYGDAAHPWLLTQVSTPLNGTSPLQYKTTHYTYGTDGHVGDLTQVTDPDGKVWTYGYDQYGDKASTTDPVGDMTTDGYDTAGRMTSTVSPKGNCTGCISANFASSFTYDNENHLLTSTDPLNHTTIRTYYPGGKVHTSKDPDGNTTTYAYDGDEELQSVTRADNTVQTINHDPNGNVTSEVSAAGGNNQVAYGYDSFDHVNATTFTDATGARTTSAVNDPLGHPITVTDAANQTTTYSYDAAERLVGVHYSDLGTHDVTNITYDADSQRTGMTDGTGQSTWVWDSLHRLKSSTDGFGRTVGYGYDLRGHVTTLTYPDGHQVQRRFDDAGRMTHVIDWLGHDTTFTPDDDSNIGAISYPNQTTAGMAYDNVDGLTGVTDKLGSSTFGTFGYTRDNNEQVQTASAGGVPAPTGNTYTYTPLNQLAQDTTTSTAPRLYAYDLADSPARLDNTVQSFDTANEVQQAHSSTLVGTNAAGATTNTSLTLSVPLPAGTAAGDLILVASTQPTGITATSTGYSQVTNVSATPGGHTTVLQKTAAAGDTAVPLTYSALSARAVVVLVYRGPGSLPLDAVGAGGQALTPAKSVTAPSTTASTPGDRLVLFQGVNQNAQSATWTAPGDMTEEVQSSEGLVGAGAADEVVPVAGATGSKTSTLTQSGDLDAVLVAVTPALTSFTYNTRGDRTGIAPPVGSAVALSYDQANRLTGYGSSATYRYNGDGLRMSKTVSGVTEQFAYDVAEGLPLPILDGSTEFVYGPGGQPIEQLTAQPAISLVGSGSHSNPATTTSQSLSVPLPTGIHSGDQIIVGVTFAQGVANSVKTPPAGYTQVGAIVKSSGTAPNDLVVFRKTADGSESGTNVVIGLSGLFATAGAAAVYRGVDPNNPIDVTSPGSTNGGSTVSPTITTTRYTADRWVILQGASYLNTSAQSWAAPAGMQEEVQASSGTIAAGLADTSATTSGSTGTLSSTLVSASGQLTTMFVGFKTPPSIVYLHHDQLGSTRLLTDEAGSVAGGYTFDPFGGVTASSGTVTTPLLYTGQYRDVESGFYYLRARYYDPATGQFLSRDPRGSGLSNTYAYAADSPLNATDPTGLAWCPVQALCDFFGGNGQRVTDWFAAHSRDVARYTSATLNAAVALIPVVGEVRLAELGAEAGAVAGEEVAAETASVGARDTAVEATQAGEQFVRVGASPENLNWTFDGVGGTRAGTYAFPKETFDQIGMDPAALKNFGDLPGSPPSVYRILEPPAGAPIQRGIVPGGEFGGVGGVPEVFFPEGF